MTTNYQKQVEEIKSLAKSIIAKSEKFAVTTKGPYFEDLLHVIAELKDINSFLK